MFDSARNAGAEQISLEEANSHSQVLGNTFEGGIYRLGGHSQESRVITSSSELQNNEHTLNAVSNFFSNIFNLKFAIFT